jgi:hypothetical protein
MSTPLAERQDLMNLYKDQVMAGYNLENTITDEWMARLPLFIRIIRMQELMHYTQYLNVPDERAQAGLRYKIRWIEEDIPSMVFLTGFSTLN